MSSWTTYTSFVSTENWDAAWETTNPHKLYGLNGQRKITRPPKSVRSTSAIHPSGRRGALFFSQSARNWRMKLCTPPTNGWNLHVSGREVTISWTRSAPTPWRVPCPKTLFPNPTISFFIQALGFGLGLGFGLWALGFGIWLWLWLWLQDLGLGFGFGFRIWVWVQDLGLGSGFGFGRFGFRL